ncbi:hypothetical protein AGOR_G00222160 [Albula goreensis]|uniref:Uncharacterized protein n=1 Tax=Albula goreensis TaxID=1534307 RepID=A0A8T3CNA7_9TELE|nr:hypothetical protein AGOR_G00222160 [Albula goreensis]
MRIQSKTGDEEIHGHIETLTTERVQHGRTKRGKKGKNGAEAWRWNTVDFNVTTLKPFVSLAAGETSSAPSGKRQKPERATE